MWTGGSIYNTITKMLVADATNYLGREDSGFATWFLQDKDRLTKCLKAIAPFNRAMNTFVVDVGSKHRNKDPKRVYRGCSFLCLPNAEKLIGKDIHIA